MSSCDPCEECGDPILREPTVYMVFINQDSLIRIDSALLSYDSLDSSFNSINGILADLRDSLIKVEDSLALGLAEYEDEKDALLDSINKTKLDSIFLDSLAIDSNTNVLNTIKTTINSGLIRLDSYQLLGSGQGSIISDENDSLTSWPLPLDFNNNLTAYELFIANEEFTIELGYETFTEVGDERNVVVRAENIEVLNHTFDDLDSCNENCIDGEATFIFYF